MLFLKLVASTVVICSGCDNSSQKEGSDFVKIGVSTDLLSFDPFSFQSLGERDVIDLIYDRLFEIEGLEVKSNYLKNLKIHKKKISFDKMSDELFGETQAVFFKGKSSVLWKDVFNQFKLERTQIKYLKGEDFIAQLKTLWPLLVFEGYGAYKVVSHIKGVSLTLKSSRSDVAENLKIIRVKENQVGIDMVLSGAVDIYFPSMPFSKGLLGAYKNLEINESKSDHLKLRMYHKFGAETGLGRVYCNNQKDFEKMLGVEWRLEEKACDSSESLEQKDISLIYSDRVLMKYLDFLHNRLKEKTGASLNYDMKSSLNLTKVLKMGQFDHHLSLERIGEKTPVLKDSFHSKGRYNSYRLKDPLLDRELEKLSKSSSLESYKRFEQVAKKRLNEVLPLSFSYTKPLIESIRLKSSIKCSSKSSKRLIFIK